MKRSHVSMEQKKCMVTGKDYDSGALLIDKRLKNSMEKHTITGWGISPEVQEKLDDGFIVLVGCDDQKSEKNPDGSVSPDKAYRTGEILYMKRHIAEAVFNIDIKNMAFVDNKAIEIITEKYKDVITKI